MNDENETLPADILKSVIQIGIVVPDIEAVKENMKQLLGAEPDFAGERTFADSRYKGEKSDPVVRMACYDRYGVQLEFIEPVGDEKSVWMDHLKGEPGPGYALHHIRFADVPDSDKLTESMAQHGVDAFQWGYSIVNPGGKYSYYDTREQLGFVLELVTNPTLADGK